MVSVCMATYNGEKYIEEQLISILVQLSDNDEIVVSDDGSIDSTKLIIETINDQRIKFIEGPHQGVAKNFENAILHAKGDYIFLSDQDDVWNSNKISNITRLFQTQNRDLICHNFDIIDANGSTVSQCCKKNVKTGFWLNLYKPKMFTGNCMAFRASSINIFLPIPKNKYIYHDNWIGLCYLKFDKSKVLYIPESYIRYRRHGENVSTMKSDISVFKRLYVRVLLWFHIERRLLCKTISM